MNNNILYIINQTSYNPSNYQKIINFFVKNFSSNSNSKIYLINHPILNEIIFVVKYELPVKFGNQTIDVSLLIYFPSIFPLDIEFYLENKKHLCVNYNYSNDVINRENLKLNLDFFCNWDSDKLNFSEIIKTLQLNFNTVFPAFKSMNSNEYLNYKGCCILNNVYQEVYLGNNNNHQLNIDINNNYVSNRNNNNGNNINRNNNVIQFRNPKINQKKRMNQNDIDKLGTELYNINNKYSTKNCRICLEDFKKDDVLRRLSCFHIFHKNCIDPWLKENGMCPIDKFNIELI